MKMRIAKFNLGEGKLESAKGIFADLVPQIEAQPGCQGVTAFGNEETGKYGMVVMWDSAETAEAAKHLMGPQLSKHLADNEAADREFSTRLFDVL